MKSQNHAYYTVHVLKNAEMFLNKVLSKKHCKKCKIKIRIILLPITFFLNFILSQCNEFQKVKTYCFANSYHSPFESHYNFEKGLKLKPPNVGTYLSHCVRPYMLG
jgi:hypothetical protein